MNKVAKKLKQNNGFTLSELLIATLILLLVSGMLVTCIHLGLKQLYKQTQESEAQILCTTLSTAIQDELSYAGNVETETTSDGEFVSFSKESKKVGFYIASETTDDNPENFKYKAVTDQDSISGEDNNLGKIYIRSVDTSNPSDIFTYGLVSTGAYNIENSGYGSLQAGMKLTKTDGGFKVRVEVYNGQETPELLSYKDFYVGRISASLTGIGVDTSMDTYSITFDPNGGAFADGSTSPKTYPGFFDGDVFEDIPQIGTHPNGYEFVGWSPTITDGKITVSGTATYTALWTGGNTRAVFYLDERYIEPGNINGNIGTIDAAYGTVMGVENVGGGATVLWPTVSNSTISNFNNSHSSNPFVLPSGYEFVGWRALSTGKVYYMANKDDTWKFRFDEKFIAVFSPKYTASFYSDGSVTNPTGHLQDVSVAYQTILMFPTAPTKNGYAFAGWEYEDAENHTVVTRDATMIYTFNTDKVFVAKWEKRITFWAYDTMLAEAVYDDNGNFASFKSGNTFDTFGTMKDGIAHVAHTGAPVDMWTFQGWYYHYGTGADLELNPDGTPVNQNALKKLLSQNGNLNLYAGWTNNKAIYYRSDYLPAANDGDSNNFLIVGESYGNKPYETGGNSALHITGSGRTAPVTVLGDDVEMYTLASSTSTYAWKTENASDGRVYLKKLNENKYLDIDTHLTGSDTLYLANSNNVRQWTYGNAKLTGYNWWSGAVGKRYRELTYWSDCY